MKPPGGVEPADDEPNVRVQIEAWFAPRTEFLRDDKTISVLTFCRVCNVEVLRRKWDHLSETATVTETAYAEAERHEAARIDADAFLVHLRTAHPEKFEDGVAS